MIKCTDFDDPQNFPFASLIEKASATIGQICHDSLYRYPNFSSNTIKTKCYFVYFIHKFPEEVTRETIMGAATCARWN